MRKGALPFSIVVVFFLLVSGYVEVVYGISNYDSFPGGSGFRKTGFAVIGTLDSNSDGNLEIIFSKVWSSTGTLYLQR